jgi:hypothetical protein
MKKMLLLAAAFFFLVIFSTGINGQTRIAFSRGQTSKVITGKLSGFNSERKFVVRVKKGQTLITAAVKNYITIAVEAPPGSIYEQDMAADCHDKNEVTPTAAGDYEITVYECKKADPWRGTFKFRVTVK